MLINLLIALGVLGIIAVFIIFSYIAASSSDKETFDVLPQSIVVRATNGPYDERLNYTLTRMPFKKWRQLFELDPTAFIFVNKHGQKADPPTPTKTDYATLHPCCTATDNNATELYLIEFSFWDYLQYHLYAPEIAKRYCALEEQKISMSIVGDVRQKIEALEAESRENIQRSLDLQKEIVLRMGGKEDGPKES